MESLQLQLCHISLKVATPVTPTPGIGLTLLARVGTYKGDKIKTNWFQLLKSAL